jgi:hypothetical protein
VLGGLENISGPADGLAPGAALVQPPPVCPEYTVSKEEIKDCQAKLKGYFKANMQLNLGARSSEQPNFRHPRKGRQTMKRIFLALILLAACRLAADAQPPTFTACTNVDYSKLKSCSLTGVNGNCTIVVDRMRAATPPTIYVRRGSIVTLSVINPSPLEKLTLDETAINTQIPIDSVQALAPLLTQLGQFALAMPEAAGPAIGTQELLDFDLRIQSGFGVTPPPPPTFDSIVQEQTDLSSYIDASTKLDIGTAQNPGTLMKLADALATLRALLVPPLDACNSNSDWRKAYSKVDFMLEELRTVHGAINARVGDPGTGTLGAGVRLDNAQRKLVDIQGDIDIFKNNVALAQKASDDQVTELKAAIADLKKKIEQEEKKPRPDRRLIQSLKDQIPIQQHKIDDLKAAAAQSSPIAQRQIDALTASQGVLTDKLTKAQTIVKTVLFPAETKLQTLINSIGKPPASSTTFTIPDLLRGDKNDEQEVFTLNAVNYLTDPVKISIASATTDPYSQALADSIVATAPTKTAVMTATVQYVTQPKMEVAAGVLVPFLAYKSYAAVAQSAGSATLITQENRTYTIVPSVNLNFRLGNDFFPNNKRVTWFATTAVGYNPATTSVEFGVGPSIAVKSMVFSFLADIGRDMTLANGFTLNQPLPGAATVPATNTVWSVKPSFGFSIRLPFNSGGGN